MFKGMEKEKLLKIKKYSKYGVFVGIFIALLSAYFEKEADEELFRLDQSKLDQVRLK